MNDSTKHRIWNVLVTIGANEHDRDDFIRNWPGCKEFRFQGELGLGGKIWAPTFGQPPRVSAYPESKIDPIKIANINAILAAIAPATRRWR